MRLHFHIDCPGSFKLPGPYLKIRGWGFLPDRVLRAVRLRCAIRSFDGVYGSVRPDVAATYPNAPGDNIGFEIRGKIGRGRHTAVLEFQDDQGQWHTAIKFELQSSHWNVPAWAGGQNSADLLAFQLATLPSHAPRKIKPEIFPRFTTGSSSRPRLSLVTPSFQQCRFLEETIRSVLDQSTVDVSYVIQDGGSTDGSYPLIRSYASRLTAYETGADGGQANAIKRGFEKTSGAATDVMGWINSDDFYLPGALAYVADFFAANPAVDVVYGHRVLVNENSQEVGRWFLPRHDEEILRLYDFVPQETLFWRRRIWDQVGGLDPSFQFAMDWDLLLRFQAAGAKITRIPVFLACFRLHPTQKTTAQIHDTGQQEIDRLRKRTFGHAWNPQAIEAHPRIRTYLRQSAWLEFIGRYGYRGPAG